LPSSAKSSSPTPALSRATIACGALYRRENRRHAEIRATKTAETVANNEARRRRKPWIIHPGRANVLRLGAVAAAAALPAPAIAQAGWPSKPIRIVCSYPPGALTDISPAPMDNLAERRGSRAIVENKAVRGRDRGRAGEVRAARG